MHDFLIKELGRAVPYGVYDIAANTGWVSVGVSHDTAAFAVQTLRRWWAEIGSVLPTIWALEAPCATCRPGPAKWNKIEHWLFSFVTWKARSLVSYRVIVDLISATTTDTGLTVRCELDSAEHPEGIVASDKEMDGLTLAAMPSTASGATPCNQPARQSGRLFPDKP